MSRPKHLIPATPRRRPISEYMKQEDIDMKRKGPPKPPAKEGPVLRDEDGRVIRALVKNTSKRRGK